MLHFLQSTDPAFPIYVCPMSFFISSSPPVRPKSLEPGKGLGSLSLLHFEGRVSKLKSKAHNGLSSLSSVFGEGWGGCETSCIMTIEEE